MSGRARIDRLLLEATKERRVPGVVAAVANGGGVVYEGAIGRRWLPDGPPMTPDTVFAIASMTKTVTAIAAMQLVEQGRLGLDRPVGEILPELANPLVLAGFSATGEPLLRPARRPITLRHLLTHTAGFGYDTWNEQLRRFARATDLPAARTGKRAALNAPLTFDPGERWQYGIGIDWAGQMIEAASGKPLDVYFHDHIFAPLGMRDIGYDLRPDQTKRLAKTHSRNADGSLTTHEPVAPGPREFVPGGGGLYATAGDYLTLLRMLLNGGALGDVCLLRPDTVADMGRNHIGEIGAGVLRSSRPDFSVDLELFPGMPKRWGLSFLINTGDVPGGRAAGSLAWAGLLNTHFWLDPKRRIAAVFMTQVLPFGDAVTMRVLDAFERAVYEAGG